MKSLKFKKNLERLILNGQKTDTWRIFDDKDLQVGDQLELIEWESGQVFAYAQITAIRHKQLGEISEPDFLGHERFQDTAEMLQHYRDFYGDTVTMETMIKVVTFELVDAPTPEPAQPPVAPPIAPPNAPTTTVAPGSVDGH